MTDINMLLMSYAKYFPAQRIPEIKAELQRRSSNDAAQLLTMSYKDPMVALVLGLTLGSLGIDRFYIGDTNMGVLKLIFSIVAWCIFFISCGILFFIPFIWGISTSSLSWMQLKRRTTSNSCKTFSIYKEKRADMLFCITALLV
jgi:TM2 domain-containing membrane protein YozV